MNFLLHRHLAARDLGSLAASVGAMLPDLWRMAGGRGKAPDEGARAGVEPVLGELLAGVAHHFEQDRWFHGAPVFVDGEAVARERLRASGCTAPKLLLFAHPIWEMCLDGALVRREGLKPTLRALREGFALTRPFLVGAAEASSAWTRGPAAPFELRVGGLCASIEQGAWVGAYQSGEGLTACVDGMRRRLKLALVDASERPGLAAALARLLDDADAALDGVLELAAPA